jgi:hypothetical protein
MNRMTCFMEVVLIEFGKATPKLILRISFSVVQIKFHTIPFQRI